ncbi:MAG: hypothetical protein U9O53_04415 [archaeon]|nr:hypothetical protein [archaeon]
MRTSFNALKHKSFDFSEVERLINLYGGAAVSGTAYEMFEFLLENDESFFLNSYNLEETFASGFIVLSGACFGAGVDKDEILGLYGGCRVKACSSARELYGRLVLYDRWEKMFKGIEIPILCCDIA